MTPKVSDKLGIEKYVEFCGFVNSSYVLGTDKFLTDFGITDRPKVHSIPTDKLTPIKFLKDGAWN